MVPQEYIDEATLAVCERLRRSSLDGLADMLAWASATGDARQLFLAAEWCHKAARDADLLPSKAPATFAKAFRASAEAGMLMALGVTKKNGRLSPTGFGMNFPLCARSAPLLIPALQHPGILLGFDEAWGGACNVPRLGGGRGGDDILDGNATLDLHSHPLTDEEREVFASALERCNSHGIPWIRTMDCLMAPQLSSAGACHMLFHATGHLCGGDPLQARLFLDGAMREAAA